jgi:hypothetical protein
MSAAVDVLAVMDRAVGALDGWSAHPTQATSLREARDAVAEMIRLLDKATGYVEAVSSGTAQHIDPLVAELMAASMNEALARCGGAA